MMVAYGGVVDAAGSGQEPRTDRHRCPGVVSAATALEAVSNPFVVAQVTGWSMPLVPAVPWSCGSCMPSPARARRSTLPAGTSDRSTGWVPARGADHHQVLEQRLHTTNLQQLLTTRGIGELVLGGLGTEQCCETTARVAADLGDEVTFVTDATATFPIPHRAAPTDRMVAELLADP